MSVPPIYRLPPTAYRLLPTAYCLLPTAYCLLPTAYCLLPTAYCLPRTAYCLPPTAYLLLHPRSGFVAGAELMLHACLPVLEAVARLRAARGIVLLNEVVTS